MKDDDSSRLAVLEEQGRYVAREMAEIKADVKTLVKFRWQVYGVALLAAFLATSLVEIARAFY